MKQCGYCRGGHEEKDCPVVFKPIIDCVHANTLDGTCEHSENMTPECHVGACPRLDPRVGRVRGPK